MIRVDVEKYCHSCLDFTPNVTAATRTIDGTAWSDTVIQCEYRKRCAGIQRYLEQQMKKETEAVG